MANKAINDLSNITQVVPDSSIVASNVKNELYVVSHPKNSNSYDTYNITLSQLFNHLCAISYKQLYASLSNDLDLKAFAHQETLENNLIVDGSITLNKISGVGPLAKLSSEWPNLSFNSSTDTNSNKYIASHNKLGFRYLAFKDKITSADIDGKIQIDQIDGAKDLISTASASLNLQELAHMSKTDLGLGSLATKDTINTSDVDSINFDRISNWERTLSSNFLSAATSSSFGSVKLGFAQDLQNKKNMFALSVDSDGNAFTYVPYANTHENTKVEIEAGDQPNTISVHSYTEDVVDSEKTTSLTTTTKITIKEDPKILKKDSNINNIENHIAVFSKKSSQLHGLDNAIHPGNLNYSDKFLNQQGSFTKLPLASELEDGMLSKDDYFYIHSLSVNLPNATDSRYGAVKIGFEETNNLSVAVQLDNDGKMFVEMPPVSKAVDSEYGGVKTGYVEDQSTGRIPVKLSIDGKMYVENDVFKSGFLHHLLDIFYPINSIFVTKDKHAGMLSYMKQYIDVEWQYLGKVAVNTEETDVAIVKSNYLHCYLRIS